MEEHLEYASVDDFERKNPALAGMMRRAVREELETAQANGTLSGDAHLPFDLGKIASDAPMVFRDSADGIGQCDECPVRIAPHCSKLRILGGINWFPFHMFTSFLALGGIIVASAALGAAMKRDERKTVA